MTYVHALILYPTYDDAVELIGIFTSRKNAQKYIKFEDDWGGDLEIKKMKLDCVTALYR